ncbi:hypothetical protein ACVIJ6_001655 [Bradyrhizobium sp. USDA 4369]
MFLPRHCYDPPLLFGRFADATHEAAPQATSSRAKFLLQRKNRPSGAARGNLRNLITSQPAIHIMGVAENEQMMFALALVML